MTTNGHPLVGGGIVFNVKDVIFNSNDDLSLSLLNLAPNRTSHNHYSNPHHTFHIYPYALEFEPNMIALNYSPFQCIIIISIITMIYHGFSSYIFLDFPITASFVIEIAFIANLLANTLLNDFATTASVAIEQLAKWLGKLLGMNWKTQRKSNTIWMYGMFFKMQDGTPILTGFRDSMKLLQSNCIEFGWELFHSPWDGHFHH